MNDHVEVRDPEFGEWLRGIHASESNPHRDGMYVRTIRRTGRLNPGTWYVLTDGCGGFWEYPAESVTRIDAPQPPSGGEPMTGDLLPCPFCGKTDQDRYPCEWLDGSGANVIRCAWCHGAAPLNAWNRRTAPPSAPVGLKPMVGNARVPDDYRNQASGYRAGWNDVLHALAQQPAAVTQPGAGEVSNGSGQPAAVDEAMVEEANEHAAIAAYERHMGVSADDPAYGPDLAQWMAGWNAALAQQPAAVDEAVKRLAYALLMHDQHRTTVQSLASAVGDFLRDYNAAQPGGSDNGR